jgi:glycosyltransferase involved in cell wall biosynthesis
MRILVDARLSNDYVGGVKKALEGLAFCFKEANFGDLEFVWLTNHGSSDWLQKYLPANSQLLEEKAEVFGGAHLKTQIAKIFRVSNIGDLIISGLRRYGPIKYKLPNQPKIIESVAFDVIHFPMQFGFATMYPNVYQPHDFQHLHLPKNFSKETMVLRNTGMGSMMQQASQIIVGAEWTRNDLVNFYPVYRERVLNVPVYPRPLLEDSGTEVAVIKQIGDYIFYPAMDWPHKNHSGLIKVFAKVTRSFPNLSLVLAGGNLSSNKDIATLVEVLGIADKVRFTGFLSEAELFHFYQNAKIMVMPSFFESESLPIWEAFIAKVPVLSAAITAIPEQVKSSALLFNPNNDIDFYEKMVALLMNSELRSQLVERGIQRVSNLSAYNSALGYRFAYRRAAGKEIDDLDSSWLENSFTF